MGNRLSGASLDDDPGSSRKRKAESDDEGPDLKTTKIDTAQYVYERLFLQGEGSDITIHALGEQFNLHKLYLQQCNYFEVLLNHNWSDSERRELSLEIPDAKITVAGLRTVFGSLYQNEIKYTLEDLEAILAAASFFQLETVLNRCDESMCSDINETTILRFLDMAQNYGLSKVRRKCLNRLKTNLWRYFDKLESISELSEDTLVYLLSSNETLVVESEFDIYTLIKNWLYLCYNPDAIILSRTKFVQERKQYFSNQPMGYIFSQHPSLFASLRLHQLLATSSTIKEVEEDNLIPPSILSTLLSDLYKIVVSNEEDTTTFDDVADEDFYLNCIRRGRVIDTTPKCWRWTGYNFGFDLVLNFNRGLLTLRRNCTSLATPYSVNLKTERPFHFRLVICDSSGESIWQCDKQKILLRVDQCLVVCRLPPSVQLPISVHISYLSSNPTPPSLLYINQFMKNDSVVKSL